VTALCRTRPADWWDTGDDGNRLALLLCSVCPGRTTCSEGDPEPHGVIRGGVAWSDAGVRLPLCACGRPAPGRAECYDCDPPAVRSWADWRAPVSREERICALSASGVSYRAIALEFGLSKSMVARIVQGGRPQAVSTEEDAA
jgi:hypothetical protein